ncbi:unnamed protein product [Victoria cruziana]
MASQGQDLRHKAGEAAGHAQVKKDELVQQGKEACQAMKDKASSGMQAVKDAANSAAEKCSSAAHSDGQQSAGGLLQQTGEQAKSMAQGAADAVKNTVGIGSGNNSCS